jgi:hypothetical protein
MNEPQALAQAKLTKQPSILQGQMRDYQLEGLNWMLNLHDNNISGASIRRPQRSATHPSSPRILLRPFFQPLLTSLA